MRVKEKLHCLNALGTPLMLWSQGLHLFFEKIKYSILDPLIVNRDKTQKETHVEAALRLEYQACNLGWIYAHHASDLPAIRQPRQTDNGLHNILNKFEKKCC